ncbi:D-alanyl-D-alanine carboxypeptidase family protein [Promicromonospora sukumoe]|uniref:D-alanyl-D-alanine carboxypeptidase family protein n=1 Tax=Promicromonospora sukumoe TaxID=88382 RepID=UPI00036A6AD4|nr:D-alanyl-D-alanine carboxypeptidase family protein [Promicromonospora sukumoe]
MNQAKSLVPHVPRTGLRRYLRRAWTGAVATAIAAGVLVTAAASVPGTQVARDGDDLPIRLYGLLQSVTVGETETAPQGVSLAQIVAVLERAEQEAQEQGPAFSPTVAQAAAELGMLYTTYQMQQLAFGENNEGLRIEDAPARGTGPDAGPPSRDSDREDDADGRDAGQDADEENTDEGDSGQDDSGQDETGTPSDDDTPPAVQVSNELTSVVEPAEDDPHAGYVTYDEVVIAAVRLANMLDPSVPNALVEVEGLGGVGGRAGVSLRESLLDVVSAFGGSTLGYSNGRIPTDVLCPLSFAPGHMLRCDAAERFTALNAEFEREFGYPIPITDSYRSYELQVAVAKTKPHLAAVPGTSNHGWGLAVDLGNPIAGGASAQYVWLRLHGPDYGWDNPSWARIGGAKPEPWHFEFFAAGSIPNRAIDPSDVGTWTPSDSATPRYKPSPDPKPSGGSSAGKPAKPSDKPGANPPSQKPPKPTPKPTPSDPKPTEPKPTDPTTKPTPSPTPTPDPSDDPSEEPTPDPSDEPTEEPTPDPSPDPSEEPSPDPSDPECEVEVPAGATAEEKAAAEKAAAEKAAAEKAADEASAEEGTSADDDATDEDPCAPDEDPEGTADAASSSPLGVLSKSSTVRASRRPRRPELS